MITCMPCGIPKTVCIHLFTLHFVFCTFTMLYIVYEYAFSVNAIFLAQGFESLISHILTKLSPQLLHWPKMYRTAMCFHR